MLPWKPFLAVVPAGLLLGLVAGQATRPVMLVKDDRPWPNAAAETAREADRWPTFDLSGPETASRGYSYRPDIDYDLYAWPDQTDRSAELLAADYDYAPQDTYAARYGGEDDLPITRRAVAELAGRQAERIAGEAAGVPVAARDATGPDDVPSADVPSASPSAESAAFVLPPVPPPLAHAGALPDEPELEDDEVF